MNDGNTVVLRLEEIRQRRTFNWKGNAPPLRKPMAEVD